MNYYEEEEEKEDYSSSYYYYYNDEEEYYEEYYDYDEDYYNDEEYYDCDDYHDNEEDYNFYYSASDNENFEDAGETYKNNTHSTNNIKTDSPHNSSSHQELENIINITESDNHLDHDQTSYLIKYSIIVLCIFIAILLSSIIATNL